MNGQGNAAAAGQHDVEEGRTFPEQKTAVYTPAEGTNCVAGDGSFGAAAGNESAIEAVRAHGHLRTQGTCGSSSDFDKGDEGGTDAFLKRLSCEAKNVCRLVG
jgi:hypothetical protein